MKKYNNNLNGGEQVMNIGGTFCPFGAWGAARTGFVAELPDPDLLLAVLLVI